VIGNVVSNAFCSRAADTSLTCLNERLASVQSIFHNVWTEVRKQEGVIKEADFVFNKEKTSCCLSPGCATMYETIDENEVDTQVQNNTALKFAKNCAN